MYIIIYEWNMAIGAFLVVCGPCCECCVISGLLFFVVACGETLSVSPVQRVFPLCTETYRPSPSHTQRYSGFGARNCKRSDRLTSTLRRFKTLQQDGQPRRTDPRESRCGTGGRRTVRAYGGGTADAKRAKRQSACGNCVSSKLSCGSRTIAGRPPHSSPGPRLCKSDG